MPLLSSKEEAAIFELLHDDIWALENCYNIPHKDPSIGLVPFKLTPAQLKVALALKSHKKVFVVKPRQIGITSIGAGIFLNRTMYTPYTNTLILAHKTDVTERIFEKISVLYDSLPFELRIPLSGDSRTYKYFDKFKSSIYIETAGSKVSGRSTTVHNLHCSEIAFWDNEAINRVLLPAMQSVPLDGTILLETTPNGEGNYAYEEVQSILNNESIFHLVVLHWFDEPSYIIPINHELALRFDDLKGLFDYTPEEEQLFLQHSLTRDQIRWRRYKIRELGDLFFQECLESLDTCFLTLDLPFYDRMLTTELTRKTYPAKYSFNNTLVYEQPIKEHTYILGVDPGQARQTQSAGVVIDVTDPAKIKVVAKRAALIPPDLFGEEMMKLGYYYNTALMNPEANAHGIAFLDAVKDKYPRIYIRRDIVSGIAIQRLGWITTSATKPRMMDELNYHLRTIEIPDAEIVSQIRGARVATDARGTPKQNGTAIFTTMDDQHDALCLALISNVGRDYRRIPKPFSSGFTKWK